MIDFSTYFNQGPIIMGVVNVTPDSFSDGGDYLDPQLAINHGLRLVEEGADILDIGGESTRPYARPVTVEEEQKRILPVIEGLKKSAAKVLISVDTRNAETMQKAIDLGANIVNDISALSHDSEAINVVSKAQVPVILMHMRGTPETMQNRPAYDDVIDNIIGYLEGRISSCIAANIDRKMIVCDPGIGFGKTLEDNLKILENMNKFHDLGCPILLGASRKSFIEKICPNTPTDGRLAGSLAAALKALEQGVQMFRVHDVKETRQAFAVWQAIHGH